MPYLIPPWRSFVTLASDNESVLASVCCNFSFATLEVACCHPGKASFALTEQKQSDAWRWAICSTEGLVLHTGCEPTQTGAKRVAEEALRLEGEAPPEPIFLRLEGEAPPSRFASPVGRYE